MRSKLLQQLGANLGLEDADVVVAPAEPVSGNSDTEGTIPASGTAAAVAAVNANSSAPVATPGVADATGQGTSATAAVVEPNATAAAPAEAAVIEGGDDSMEAELLDTQAAQTEVSNTEEAVEELEEVHAGLESIARELQTSVQDGGLNGQAAQYLQLATEAYTVRLGMEQRMIPSLESFGGTTDKLAATKISLEAVKDTIRKVWDAILRTIRRIRAMIKNFFLRVFNAAGKIKQRAEALKAQASKVSGNAKEGEIDVGGAASALAVGGNFPSNLAGEMNVCVSLADDIFTSFHDKMVNACNAFATGLSGAGTEAEKLAGLIDGFSPELPSDMKAAESSEEGVLARESSELPGGKALYIAVRAKNGAKAKPFEVNIVEKSKAGNVKSTISTLTGADVVKVCDAVIKIAGSIEAYKSKWQTAEGAVNNLTRAGDAFTKKVEGGAGGENAAQTARVINVLTQSVDAAQSKLSGYLLGVCKAALAVSERSVKQYGATTSAAAPAGAAAGATA